MPTPNEREIYLGSWCRTKAGSAALADLIAQYRESIIASEREAAADRGDDWLDEQVKSSGMEDNPAFERLRLKQHASLRAKIVDGQSASPALVECGGEAPPVVVYEPATPLQEAWDRGEDVRKWQIRLCWPTEDNPFNKFSCIVDDIGYADRIVSVSCPEAEVSTMLGKGER
jgi:hypothetical protein